MTLTDTHGHLNFAAYKDDLNDVITRTLEAGMRVIMPGSQYATSKRAVELANSADWQNHKLYAAIGLHPIHVGEKREVDVWETQSAVDTSRKPEAWEEFVTRGEDFNKEAYAELAGNKKTVAVGEVGLDYYRLPKSKSKRQQLKDAQKEVLQKQVDIALENDLPVIIHCRVAFDDTLQFLREQKQQSGDSLRGVIHSYTGTVEQAKEFMDLGFFLGFNGLIFKDIPALPDPADVISEIPLDRILLETDAPYLTPPQSKTERNEPLNVRFVAERIAEIKKATFEEVAQKTAENAEQLFRLD